MRRVMFDARVLALWNAVVDVWFAWVSGQLGRLENYYFMQLVLLLCYGGHGSSVD